MSISASLVVDEARKTLSNVREGYAEHLKKKFFKSTCQDVGLSAGYQVQLLNTDFFYFCADIMLT
jgi:hypothetical protein